MCSSDLDAVGAVASERHEARSAFGTHDADRAFCIGIGMGNVDGYDRDLIATGQILDRVFGDPEGIFGEDDPIDSGCDSRNDDARQLVRLVRVRARTRTGRDAAHVAP